MALATSIFPPAGKNGTTATLGATTASSAITLGNNVIFAINASDDFTITFGNGAAPTTPSATVGFRIPANTTATFDLGRQWDRFQIYNGTSGTITYSYQQLSRF